MFFCNTFVSWTVCEQTYMLCIVEMPPKIEIFVLQATSSPVKSQEDVVANSVTMEFNRRKFETISNISGKCHILLSTPKTKSARDFFFFISTLSFSSNVQHHINGKSSVEVMEMLE